MKLRRYGFWSKLTFTMKTSTSSPNMAPATASALPHWPAPVSVASFRIPSSRL